MKTIHEAAEAIRNRSLTPVDLVEQCLSQIDRWEEQVRAWVLVDRDGAREEAQRLTAELHQNQYRGPLHGIPMGVKDIFDLYDWPTAAGSKRWENSIARADAPVVARLRQAGVIFLGKTVTTQFASFDPPVTRNPWNRDRTPGGSSSGSAAALATGMCLGALGSQTGGSITRPASFCGVCGLKPTYGTLPLDGILPLAYSMDHPGPMARSVKDLAILFQHLGLVQTGDGLLPHFSRTQPGQPPPALVRFRGLFDDLAEPGVSAALDVVGDRLRQAGAQVKDAHPPARFANVLRSHRIIMAVEAAQYHGQRFRKHPEDYQRHIRDLVLEGLNTPAPEYAHAKDHQRDLSREMDRWLEKGGVLLTPATTGPAPSADTTGNPAFNSPWSFTGLPTVNFPAGQFIDGLPLGVQLIGPRGREAALLQAALWCEQALGIQPLTPAG